MGKVFTDIFEVFRRNGNLVTRLIVINVIFFSVFSLVRFGVGLFPDSAVTPLLISKNVLVSQNLLEFLNHPWTLLFHPFNQEGLFSLLFNLILVYWFGNMLADFVGGRKMFVTYLSGSFFSILFFIVIWGIFGLLNPSLLSKDFLFGASAGGFALMYAYVALNPESEMMVFTFRVKTRILVLILLGISVFKSPALGVMDLGGAVFGYIQMKLLRSGINITYGLEQIANWLGNLTKPKRKEFKKTYSSVSKGKVIQFNAHQQSESNPSQEEVDYLLDKINKEGYESLSKEEKQRLHKASQSAD